MTRLYLNEADRLDNENKKLKNTLKYIYIFCKQETKSNAIGKMDDTNHKVNQIFMNGKQRAFEQVVSYIKELEEK